MRTSTTASSRPTSRGSGPAGTDGWVPFGATVAVMAIAAVLVVGQLYAVIPLFAVMATDWAADPAGVTWTATAFGLAYAVGFLISGPASDRYGRRRVLLVGMAATAVTTAAVAAAPSLGAGLGLRVAQGATAAFYAPAALAYLAERIEPARRAAALTTLTSAFLAAAILAQVGAQLVGTRVGWQPVFLISAAAIAATAMVLRMVLRPDPPRQHGSPWAAFAAMGGLLRDPVLVLGYAATATVLAGFVALYTGLQLAGPADLAGDPTAMLALRASALPAMVAVPLLAGRLARIDAPVRVTVALTVAALSAVASGAPLGTLWIGACLLVFVAAVAVAAPSLVEMIGARAGHARGAGTAVYTFTLFAGASLGAPLASATTAGGYPAVAATSAAVLALGAVLGALGAHRASDPTP